MPFLVSISKNSPISPGLHHGCHRILSKDPVAKSWPLAEQASQCHNGTSVAFEFRKWWFQRFHGSGSWKATSLLIKSEIMSDPMFLATRLPDLRSLNPSENHFGKATSKDQRLLSARRHRRLELDALGTPSPSRMAM